MFKLPQVKYRVLFLIQGRGPCAQTTLRMLAGPFKQDLPGNQISFQSSMALTSVSRREFSSAKSEGKWYINNISHLPIAMQREVVHHLTVLEFQNIQGRRDIDQKTVREQYLKLAQKYHPDASMQTNITEEEAEQNDLTFIKVKESFDRLQELDKQSKGELFISVAQMQRAQLEKQQKASQMVELKQRLKIQKQREAEVKKRQEEAAEKLRQEEQKRQEEVLKKAREKKLAELRETLESKSEEEIQEIIATAENYGEEYVNMIYEILPEQLPETQKTAAHVYKTRWWRQTKMSNMTPRHLGHMPKYDREKEISKFELGLGQRNPLNDKIKAEQLRKEREEAKRLEQARLEQQAREREELAKREAQARIDAFTVSKDYLSQHKNTSQSSSSSQDGQRQAISSSSNASGGSEGGAFFFLIAGVVAAGAYFVMGSSQPDKQPNKQTSVASVRSPSASKATAQGTANFDKFFKEKTEKKELALAKQQLRKTNAEEEEDEAPTMSRLEKMKTYLRIPSKLPEPDPEWLLKRMRGQPLMAHEIEEFMKWKHEVKMAKFKKIIKGVHEGTLIKVHQETATKKVQCEVGAGCAGWNKEVYNGFFARCGLMDPFIIWNKHVKQKEYDESLEMFMELFDYEIFEMPKGANAQKDMNMYWQAKYGFFTCYDMWVKWGQIKFDGNLIEQWEKPKDLHRQWMMACLSVLYNNFTRTGQLVGAIDYKESKEYKRLYAKSSSHEAGLRLAAAKKVRAKADDKKSLAERLQTKKAPSPV